VLKKPHEPSDKTQSFSRIAHLAHYTLGDAAKAQAFMLIWQNLDRGRIGMANRAHPLRGVVMEFPFHWLGACGGGGRLGCPSWTADPLGASPRCPTRPTPTGWLDLATAWLVLGLLHAEPDRCRGVVADGHFHGDGELVMTLSPEHPHHEPEPCRGCHHKSTERNQRCGRLGETAHLSRGCLRVIYERLNALRLQDVTTVRAWRSRIETTNYNNHISTNYC